MSSTLAAIRPKKIISGLVTNLSRYKFSALGYTSAEIAATFKRAPKNLTTEQLIKFALREFSKF